ncbi:bifunctional 5,10-methylenetetrahydrofolate dehydrogenase/5,10-methenyltetrahydrofolate cyclohydrolase [Marivirga arenosa]|uniref:Bifunctional protein FolD n=1 Tax=Marivirga arenosa TaxID=3059076 RepID=A0AA49GCX2_9BACT|nr:MULTISPECIES: tetrahydrofolate dehydrogenase/cyclohydrolase catalytic domain-containing protein [unclassified Marivirga]WKK82196.1 tetrahydrofolate dehydrogenase/cyclohydrolase catalytic domain-containing protein [Marivirga sp. BKB1-2]WMN07497.1 tetrahydrofolate dehydrogenase/cyclohydrolase catalytic domain-containing protein [Marivirga sp. ABR2-2]
MPIILDGKKISSQIKEELKEKVELLKKEGGKVPHLSAILVGNDGASQTYVEAKVRDCQEIGFESSKLVFDDSISEEELLAEVEKLNNDERVDGFIVQLPLPKHINVDKVLNAINPEKDVDGFHPVNYGRMASNLPAYIPATPFGVMEFLKRYEIPTRGKHCVVVGRSHIVGSPVSILMGSANYPGDATVTLTHRYTENLAQYTKQADILIVAVGKPGLITGDMVKDGVIVIDVGTTRVPDTTKKSGFALKGDVIFEEVSKKASHISPVPGGVGPMTRAGLLMNTWLAAQKEVYGKELV